MLSFEITPVEENIHELQMSSVTIAICEVVDGNKTVKKAWTLRHFDLKGNPGDLSRRMRCLAKQIDDIVDVFNELGRTP